MNEIYEGSISEIYDKLIKNGNIKNIENSNEKSTIEKILDNVIICNEKGNLIKVELSDEQKNIVISQYNKSFDDDIKDYINNNSDEFEELVIANTHYQFEKLFPKGYIDVLKEQSISRFKNKHTMEAIRYGLAYSDDMKFVMNRKYVHNNRFKTLLVFNNIEKELEINIDNKRQEDKFCIEENKGVRKQIEKDQTSIFINLKGNEIETPKGVYLKINHNIEIYIPKKLYRKYGDKLEILDSKLESNFISEYRVDYKENKRELISKINLQEFYHKYYNLYKIHNEKEVISYNASK